jgi:hypothetical protein
MKADITKAAQIAKPRISLNLIIVGLLYEAEVLNHNPGRGYDGN